MPSKSKIALFFAVSLTTRRARCDAALKKLNLKLNNILALLDDWSGAEDDVRYDFYRPKYTAARAKEAVFIAEAADAPRATAGKIITYYRETLNPLLKEIETERGTAPQAGAIVTKQAASFPSLFGSSDTPPRWVAIDLNTAVFVEISGPRELLESGDWDEIAEEVRKTLLSERARAQKLIVDAESDIVGIYDQSTLANWDDLNKLTPDQLRAASEACQGSAALAKARIERANAELSVLVDNIADMGVGTARVVMEAKIDVSKVSKDYRCAYKKRVALGSLAVAGSAISLAAGIATGGGASFFGIYALVMATANIANLVRESFLNLKQTQDRLTLNMSTAKTRMAAAHGTAEARIAEGLTIVAGLMKIPTDVYGEAVGTVGEMEQSLQLYKDRAQTYSTHINELIRSLNLLLDDLEALKVAKDIPDWGISDEDYAAKIEVNEPRVDTMIEQIISARTAYPNTTRLAMKATVMVTTYKAFTQGRLLEGCASVEAALGVIGDIKHSENTIMGIVTLAADLESFTTPINAFAPTDIVDALALIASSLG